MTITSLSTTSIGASAVYGLNASTDQISASTYRLSSGNRFYRAGDDVASLSISTKLQSQLTAHRQGLLNNSQADSLLQVAYGGLTQISSILDDMKSLTVQSNSGSLTSTERAALDLQFQNLRDEIDGIADSTNFGGRALLDGTVSNQNTLKSNDSNATQAKGGLTITSVIAAGQTVKINGATFTATTAPTTSTDFLVGTSTSDQAANLAAALSASTNINVSSAKYEVSGSTISITSRVGGRLGSNFIIDAQNSTANGSFTTSGNLTNLTNNYVLGGGVDDGIYAGGSVITGTVGDSLVNTQNQTAASTTLTFSTIATSGQTLTVDDGNGGNITFTYTTAATATTDVTIGANVEEMIGNTIRAVENYRRTSTASDTFVLNQLKYEADGNALVISNRTSGNVNDLTGTAADIATNVTGASLSSATFGNGTSTGIDVTGVGNKDFVGTISGFTATFNSANNITASVTVGSSTYTAAISTTNPTAATKSRFVSNDGGYFDVELAANGATVANQSEATNFANRLTAAFSTMNIYQSRALSSFSGVGTIAGGSADIQLDSYDNPKVDSLKVSAAPSGSQDAVIEATVNGETFRSNNLGQRIGGRETITLTSLDDGNRQIRITNGTTAIDLSSSTAADTFQADLRASFGIGNSTGGLSFQIGASRSDSLSVKLDSAKSDILFGGKTPDITTQDNASAAQTLVDSARDQIYSIIAQVGSQQAALHYAYNASTNSINEIDKARSALADTDVPGESTNFANAIVQQQAAISVLAQTQRLGSNLLLLLKA